MEKMKGFDIFYNQKIRKKVLEYGMQKLKKKSGKNKNLIMNIYKKQRI
jgi:hypothetical protein